MRKSITEMEETKAKIKTYLSRFLDNHDLQDDENIFGLGFTSMFSMQLVLFLEQEFQIAIETEDLNLDNLKTLNSLVTLVETKKSLNCV
jgi:methoxymalonate biosynthesis acyl carrier protein